MSPIDPMDDDDPTEEELREAEALARALDRGAGTSELPEDALETAALLRYANGEGELRDDRKKAILDEVLASAKPRAEEAAARAPAWTAWLKWLVPGGVLAAAAVWAIVALRVAEPTTTESAVAATSLPAPSLDLLRAQARAATESEDGAELLASAMHEYRGEVYAALGERYGQ
jgi:hypothetical protein